MLGAWLALTYFALVQDKVHKHVTDLVSGRASSSYKVLILITSGVWTALMLAISITFLIMKESKLKTNSEEVSEMFKDNVDCISKYDYFSTWSHSGMIGSSLGGYLGLLYQHKNYGGQLFI